MIPFLDVDDPFPPVDLALRDPNGLLAAGADLSPARLIDAYARGIFPWFNDDDPVLWWSPDPRMVLPVNEVHLSRSLGRTIRSPRFRVTADTAFAAVVAGCAEPRPDQHGTWITKDMASAYARLFDMGYAHSIETWSGDALVGGLYGVALGRMFYGESMFAREPDTSKIALAYLVRQLARRDCGMIDCQMKTALLARFGAREIPRTEFMRKLAELVNYARTGRTWSLDDDLFE